MKDYREIVNINSVWRNKLTGDIVKVEDYIEDAEGTVLVLCSRPLLWHATTRVVYPLSKWPVEGEGLYERVYDRTLYMTKEEYEDLKVKLRYPAYPW